MKLSKFIARARRLDDLVRGGSLTPTAARFLDAAVDVGMNILVSGATQAGKTTLLNCLASAIGPRERVITVEEIFELQIPVRDVVGLQCRQPNLEGHGEIPLRRLVKEALRMRPGRLIVGEVREAEALDMLVALNSGLAGMCTIHANSAADALTKLCTLPLLAGENIPYSGCSDYDRNSWPRGHSARYARPRHGGRSPSWPAPRVADPAASRQGDASAARTPPVRVASRLRPRVRRRRALRARRRGSAARR